MMGRLRGLHAAGNQERIRENLLRWIEDPLKPKSRTGSLRIHPMLLLLAAVGMMAAGTFLVFSLIQP